MVVERMRMYTSPPRTKHTPRKLKRLSDLEDEDTYSNPNTSTKLQVHITGRRPFTYSGVEYPTVQHAFQAQKFGDESDQERIATLTLMEAVSEGRRANIDVSEWDANKAKLMYALLKAQAKEHEEMASTLVESQGISNSITWTTSMTSTGRPRCPRCTPSWARSSPRSSPRAPRTTMPSRHRSARPPTRPKRGARRASRRDSGEGLLGRVVGSV